MSTPAYTLEQDLVELIDQRIPDPDVPGSILRTYLAQILAQPGGHGLLGRFTAPGTGHTVGTALVAHRRHGLGAVVWGAKKLSLGAVRPASEDSLLRYLFDRSVDLSCPNAYGTSALFACLAQAVPLSLAGLSGVAVALAVRSVASNHSCLDDVYLDHPRHAPSPRGYDPLQVDPDGNTLAVCPLGDESRKVMQAHIALALSDPLRTPPDNLAWALASLACATPEWRPFLAPVAAHWQARCLGNALPPSEPVPPARPRV